VALCVAALLVGLTYHESHGLTARREQRRSERLLRAFRDAAAVAKIVSITDRDGVITEVNDRFCEVSGYSRNDLIGRTHSVVKSGDNPPGLFEDLWSTIASGRIWRGEICNRKWTGEPYWVESTIVPVLGGDGTPHEFVAIQTDVTERRLAAQEQREQASLARLGEMAAVVAHEVRNPLAGLRGVLQILRDRRPEADEERRVLTTMVDRIDGLDRIVSDLLHYAHPRVIRRVPLTVATLLERSVALAGETFGSRGIVFTIEAAPCTLVGDPVQLEHAVTNLLANAAQASSDGARIVVSSRADSDACEIWIDDDGHGIPDDLRARVFEPFFTTRSRGTGLGLPTASRIVTAHGGTLFLEGRESGGTRASLRLPRGR
jgi:PAS domain S-box-containing protein